MENFIHQPFRRQLGCRPLQVSSRWDSGTESQKKSQSRGQRVKLKQKDLRDQTPSSLGFRVLIMSLYIGFPQEQHVDV